MVATDSNAPAAQEIPLEGEQPDPTADVELIPMQRSGLSNTRALRFSDQELIRVALLQEWLSVTVNPETGRPFIAENTFSAFVIYSLNFLFTQMAEVAKQMAEAQEA